MNKIGRTGTIAFVVVIASEIYSIVFGSDIDLVPKEAFENTSAWFRTLSLMITQPLFIIALGLLIFSELFIYAKIDLNRNGVSGFSRVHASILILVLLTSFAELVMALGDFVVYEYSRYILEQLIYEVIWLGAIVLFFIMEYPVIKYASKRNRN